MHNRTVMQLTFSMSRGWLALTTLLEFPNSVSVVILCVFCGCFVSTVLDVLSVSVCIWATLPASNKKGISCMNKKIKYLLKCNHSLLLRVCSRQFASGRRSWLTHGHPADATTRCPWLTLCVSSECRQRRVLDPAPPAHAARTTCQGPHSANDQSCILRP